MTAPRVSSATLRVEACGALNTGMPRLAASWIDTWSVPTDRQPIASIRRACFRCSSRTFVRDRTPRMCDASITARSSSPSMARGMTSTV